MGLYLGSNKKFKVIINDIRYQFNVGSPLSPVGSIVLMSNDGYILKDSNGLYLIPKQEVDSNVN